MRLAAEPPWMVAQGASPGNVVDDPGKLRSIAVGPLLNLRRCSAAQAFVKRLAFFVSVPCRSIVAQTVGVKARHSVKDSLIRMFYWHGSDK